MKNVAFDKSVPWKGLGLDNLMKSDLVTLEKVKALQYGPSPKSYTGLKAWQKHRC